MMDEEKTANAMDAAEQIVARFGYEGIHEIWVDPRRFNELRSLALLVADELRARQP